MSVDVTAIAAQLDGAVLARRCLAAPFTDAQPDLDSETAYAVQDLVVAQRVGRGARVVGAKLGLTSRAKQERMNVDQPLYGWLTSDMALSPFAPIDLTRFIHPRVEPEIAFLIDRPIAAPATAATVLAATSHVCAAIEVIDSRYDAFAFRHPDVVADNASSAGFLLGPVVRTPAQAGDLRLLGVVLRAGGAVVATAAGAAVLGHPAESVAWLINELAARGRSLPAGSIVLSGALTDAVPIGPGGTVVAEFDGLGSVEVRA
jgi:2-oxo-3-hexenedioate decarboxylase